MTIPEARLIQLATDSSAYILTGQSPLNLVDCRPSTSQAYALIDALLSISLGDDVPARREWNREELEAMIQQTTADFQAMHHWRDCLLRRQQVCDLIMKLPREG